MSGVNPVIVVGSGAAGLAAAIAARAGGAQVTVLEATEYAGGTTALSGGVAWFPVNHIELAGENRDSSTQALDYLHSLALGDIDENLIQEFVDQAGQVAQWLEQNSALEWELLPYPDYHCEMPGGLQVGGRSLSTRLVTPSPEVAAILRPALSWRAPVTHLEVITNDINPEVLEQRRADGTVTMGQAMIAALLHTCFDVGISILTENRAYSLIRDGAQVIGVNVRSPEGEKQFHGQIILASGGFERDPELARAFLRLPEPATTGAPGAKGDGLRMAMSMGAELGNMSEAWWAPTIHIPGDEISGEPLYRLILNERSRPGCIMVDSHGRRFVNEAQNYNDVGRSMQSFDAASYTFDRAKSWLIFDKQYRDSYAIGPIFPSDPDPDFVHKGPTVEKLAESIGVAPNILFSTIETFNADAAIGVDSQFNRGQSPYDRALGDPNHEHPNLRPITTTPFYAIAVHAGTLGTKGGPRVDIRGRVRAISGGVIPGLYAVGNAAASPLGFAYPGAGGTLGPALTFGVLAGRAAATDSAPDLG
jgi:succinate dehydrogenase/fumarate reductase flavoprotein subunit